MMHMLLRNSWSRGYKNLAPYNNFSLSTREDGRLPKLVYVYTK